MDKPAQILGVIVKTGRDESLGSHNFLGLATTTDSLFRWLFFGLTLLSVIPFWTVRYPFICDYPNHLARWFVLYHWQDPLFHFSALFTPAWGPLPYITLDLLANAFQHVLSIEDSGRLILSLCIISVSLAGFLFLKKSGPENSRLALFGILIAFNPMFLLGSISYELSIALCLLTVTLWVSYCDSGRVRTALWVLLSLLLTYLTHLMGMLIAGLVMAIYALFQKARWKTLGVLAIVCAPTLTLMGYNMRQAGGAAVGHFAYTEFTAWDKFRNLVFPVRLFGSRITDAVTLAVLAIVAVFLIRGQPRITMQRAWATVCVVLLLAYLVVPDVGANGGYLDVRVMPFMFFFLLPVFRFPRVARYVVVMLALLATLRIAMIERLFIVQQPKLQQLTAAFEAIPRDARVLQIGTPDVGEGLLVGRGPTFHLLYGVIERGFLTPTLYHLPGVQPIRLTGTVYCPNVLCIVERPLSEAEWREIGLSYDYLWVQKDWIVPPLPASYADQIFSNQYVVVYRIKR